MYKYYLLILLTSLSFLISCKDDPKIIATPTPVDVEDVWPTFVDTGANMLAYKINGKIRVATNISKTDWTHGVLSCFYLLHENPKHFSFIGNRISDEAFEGIQIVINDLKAIGQFKLESVNTQYVGAYKKGTNENHAKQHTTNDIDTGYVLITRIDTIKGYITGRFEFTGRYVFGNEKVKITEGRFDLKYYR